MFAEGADTRLFGQEELHLHRDLVNLEYDLQALVDRIASGGTSAKEAAVTDKRLQELLSKIRGQIRDLSLLSEEQDT